MTASSRRQKVISPASLGNVHHLTEATGSRREGLVSDCCNDKACEIEALKAKQSSTLKAVLGINATMFGVELAAGIAAGSVALIADSLDMLGDALVYGFSLYAVTRGAREKARVGAAEGRHHGGVRTDGVVAGDLQVAASGNARGRTDRRRSVLLALLANGSCLALLWRHRADDINMRSVWLCSRNDIIANVSVLFAAVGVWQLARPGPISSLVPRWRFCSSDRRSR